MSKAYRFLVPDSLHINKKNFPSFHKFVDKHGAKVTFVTERADWLALYGNYESKSNVLNEKARVLACVPPEVLFHYSVRGVNLFHVARAEILSRVSVEPEWYMEAYPDSREGVFHKLLKFNKPTLMMGLAATWDWLEFWSNYLHDNDGYTHCCVFSGSLIYQRSVIELLRYTSTRVFVLESLFTGNDYYCEEKYEPIANNCDIRHDAVYRSLAPSFLTDNELDRDRIKAINKVVLSRNKNVEQPLFGNELSFPRPGKVVTILGQVVNDFSLLEYKGVGLSSISFYKNLINKLSEAGFNVVFKSHPWEEKKINVKNPFTRDLLTEFIDFLPQDQRDRVQVLDHYPIEKLFESSDYVTGLNSQGLIEAAFQGLKVVQFGNAFFGKRGFTHDFDLGEINRFVEEVDKGKLNGSLDLNEYRELEEFLRRLLQGQTVSVYDSGVSKLVAIFEIPSIVSLSQKRKQIPLERQIAVPKDKIGLEANHSGFAGVEKDIKEGQKQTAVIPASMLTFSGNKDGSFKRKFRKLLKSPRKFFADAKSPSIRFLRHIFPYSR